MPTLWRKRVGYGWERERKRRRALGISPDFIGPVGRRKLFDKARWYQETGKHLNAERKRRHALGMSPEFIGPAGPAPDFIPAGQALEKKERRGRPVVGLTPAKRKKLEDHLAALEAATADESRIIILRRNGGRDRD